MTQRKDWGRKVTQVVLADLEAWVQQLYEDHRVRCELVVSLPAPGDGVGHGVTLNAYSVNGVGSRQHMHADWDIISEATSGAIEAAGIKMISKLLLSLENDKAARERSEQLPLWRTA